MIILQDKKILIKRMAAIIYIQTYIIIFMMILSFTLLGFIISLLPLKEVRPWLISFQNDEITIQEVGDNSQIIEKELINKFVRTIETIDKSNGVAKDQVMQQYATQKLIELVKRNEELKAIENRVANMITRNVKIKEIQKLNDMYEVQWDGVDTSINNGTKQTHQNHSKIHLVRGNSLCSNPLNICVNSYHSTRI